MIKKYFGLTLSYGFIRGFFYNYDRNDICLNDKFSVIMANSLIAPAYIFSNLYDDFVNLKLYMKGDIIIRKKWI